MRIFRGSGWSDMQTRLIASFAIVSLLLVGLAVYQFERISQVRSSMTEQKREMDKRLSTAKISQFLQELDRLEGELKRENDAERIEPFRTVHQAMETELRRLDFSGSTAAQEDLEALRTKSGHYAGEVEKMAALLLDENADPLELLEQMDLLHTRTAAENVTMLDISSRLSAAADRNAGAAQALSFERLQDTLTMSGAAALAVIALTVVVAFLLVRSFRASVGQLERAVGRLAEGDLRERIGSSRTDELGRLSRQFDVMVDRVHGMLQRSRAVAASLESRSGAFRVSADVTAAANEEILRSIRDIAAGAESQSELSEETSRLMDGLGADVEAIAGLADGMLKLRGTAEGDTRRGQETVGRLRETSRQTEESIACMFEELERLSGFSSQISGITKSMIEISSQTHVLALNASIEAAQAGAYGKGFAVIAEEVRRLSNQTKESTTVIGGLIGRLQQGMEQFRSSMEGSRSLLLEQQEQVAATLGSFEAIGGSMTRISASIGEVHAQVDRTRDACGGLRQLAAQVSGIAESAAAAAQQVLASGTVQDEEIRRMARQAADVHELSERLAADIRLFLLREEEGEEARPDGGRARPDGDGEAAA
ncbi:Methyl-accepting chemotaxis protein [Paenibacillus pasadenensis]|uniref:Methyl-accepting chemotaxis protein n=1 Tax=Paenibacillus pasadenensis TaxID=217090 RepID=A0A2N5N4K8_9BACL|nr:methyl-accepting chemotaxis protein [Paenibacillus pasadenensis]PLT45284.1 Methyl-accepting chemotaxis protein [Paenibacillus pasadenensis]